MKKSFDYFLKKIPVNIHNNTRAIITTHIAIFIPEEFVFDKEMEVEEYHFVIFHKTPPLGTIGSSKIQFKKGSLLCMAPGDKIIVHSSEDSSPAQYMTICINKQFMESIYHLMGGKDKPIFKKLENKYSYQLLDAIEALIHEVINYEETNPLMIESLENRLAIQLLRDARLEYEMATGNQQDPQENVRKALKYIETYYSSNITIKDICQALYITPTYFQRIFLKFVGKTPYQYIMGCRLKKAREMLKTTNLSIEEIARQCGFVNIAHFSTTFKRSEGVSPLAYKKLPVVDNNIITNEDFPK